MAHEQDRDHNEKRDAQPESAHNDEHDRDHPVTPAPPLPDHESSVTDEPFQQTDIAEPFDAAIPEADAPEEAAQAPAPLTEAFQQADVAEPFDAAITEEMFSPFPPPAALSAAAVPFDTDDVRPLQTDLFPQADVYDTYDTRIESPAETVSEPLLFDDDFATAPQQRPTVTIPALTPPETFAETAFGESDAQTPAPAVEAERTFDDLTLAEVLRLFWRRPAATTGALWAVLNDQEAGKKKGRPDP